MHQHQNNQDKQLFDYVGFKNAEKQLQPTLEALGKALKLQKLKGTLYPFGSFCNGFQGSTTDLDCVFLTGCDDKPQSLFRSIEVGLRKYNESGEKPTVSIKGYIMHAKVIFSSIQVPILKIYDESNDVDIDLSINNINGIVNSKLLYEYSQMHKKIKELGLLLKLWGKNNGLIVSGSLTSYSMLILMLHFLQEKYDVPHLTDNELSQNQLDNLEFLENNPYFQTDVKPELKKLDQTSLYQLLQQFFQYYEPNGEFQKKGICVSLHSYSRPNPDQLRTLIVIDPINSRYDPSKRFQNRCIEFQGLFKQASQMLQCFDLGTFDKKEKLIRNRYKRKKQVFPQFQGIKY